MRYLWGFLVLTTMAGGEAAASSFVVPEPTEGGVGPSMLVAVDAKETGKASSPSVVARGERRPGDSLHPAIPAPSIIALGAPAPGVAAAKVSAITDEKKEGAPALPAMAIRGGLPGDAFGKALPAGQAKPQAEGAPMPVAAEVKKPPTSSRPGNSRAPKPAIIDAPG